MKRTVIKINEDLCNGCGACIEGCHENALQLIDGKARIISDSYCDGLGACIGECPVGAIVLEEREAEPYNEVAVQTANTPSQLRQWPVQLHLLNPQAGYLRNADVVLAADCVAYAYANFHNRFLRNHSIAIACPKLDGNKEQYVAKLVDMIDGAQVNTLTVIIMEVPCCSGLFQLAKAAIERASRKVPVKRIVIGIQGEIIDENWI